MNAFYSIRNFTIEKRVKRGTIGEERLVKGALFAAYVKDLSAWSRVVVKAPHEGNCCSSLSRLLEFTIIRGLKKTASRTD